MRPTIKPSAARLRLKHLGSFRFLSRLGKIAPCCPRFRRPSSFRGLGLVAGAVGFLAIVIEPVKAEIHAGPLVHEFGLTLAPGRRTEVLGPFFWSEQQETQRQFGFSPVFSYTKDTNIDSREFDFAYPILTYDRFGGEYRLQLFQVLSFSGGQDRDAGIARRFSLFPLYFQQRSADTNQNYTAVVPFYGTLKQRFMRDEIHFVLLPLYLQTRKRDVITDNYLFPFFHVRRGDGLSGWQFWPLVGREHKSVTTKTNVVDELEKVGGHEKFFALWPIYFNETTGIGTENPQKSNILLPLWSWQRSPQRDSTTYLWPLFTVTDDRQAKYREWDMPWPFVVFARGEGKTTDRVWPFFSQARGTNQETEFYLWPLYRRSRFHKEGYESERTRILFYLFQDSTENVPEQKQALRRTDLWPLFTARREHNGNERLQLLAPLESFLPNNKSIERNYAPLWSIWRSEKNAQTGAASQSFLWNLYRFERTPDTRKCSVFFGLFQYQRGPHGRHWRLFYIPLGKRTTTGPAVAKP